jgi:hypothetical protein
MMLTKMAKRMASRAANAGCAILGSMQIKHIQAALAVWVKDHERRQMEIEFNNWNEEELYVTLARKAADQNFEKVDKLWTLVSSVKPISVGMPGRLP